MAKRTVVEVWANADDSNNYHVKFRGMIYGREGYDDITPCHVQFDVRFRDEAPYWKSEKVYNEDGALMHVSVVVDDMNYRMQYSYDHGIGLSDAENAVKFLRQYQKAYNNIVEKFDSPNSPSQRILYMLQAAGVTEVIFYRPNGEHEVNRLGLDHLKYWEEYATLFGRVIKFQSFKDLRYVCARIEKMAIAFAQGKAAITD